MLRASRSSIRREKTGSATGNMKGRPFGGKKQSSQTKPPKGEAP